MSFEASSRSQSGVALARKDRRIASSLVVSELRAKLMSPRISATLLKNVPEVPEVVLAEVGMVILVALASEVSTKNPCQGAMTVSYTHLRAHET